MKRPVKHKVSRKAAGAKSRVGPGTKGAALAETNRKCAAAFRPKNGAGPRHQLACGPEISRSKVIQGAARQKSNRHDAAGGYRRKLALPLRIDFQRTPAAASTPPG